MSSGLSYSVVALHRVLHEYDWPAEQCSVLDSSMVVKVVRVHLGVDRQLACGWQFVLPRESVWRLDRHIESLPYFVMIVGQNPIAYHMFEFLVKLPFEGVLGQLE